MALSPSVHSNRGMRLDQARAALEQAPVEELDSISVTRFLARFERLEPSGRCPRCGAPLRFTSITRHATGLPPAMYSICSKPSSA
jgi:uncharacterized protein with PIN domain